MLFSTLRAGRAPLAILATALFTLTTAACAGDQRITAPSVPANTPTDVARDIGAVVADSTVVTFTINREGEFYDSGHGAVSGTYTCSRALNEWFVVVATLEQYQRDVGLVQSTASYNLSCAQEGRPVEFFFPPLSAARSFERGKAIATISVVDGAAGVVRNTMSRTVRLVHFLSN